MRRLILAAAVAALLIARGAAALPDLVPEITDVSVSTGDVDAGDVAEGCAAGLTGQRLLRYSLRARNLGPDDLVLGDPGCPDCQGNPGAACTNPLYVCSPAHGHAHFEGFAVGELVDGHGTVVAQSRKYGFCLLDYECGQTKFDCNNQGISAGCADIYDTGLPCQYIDLTGLDLAPDTYTLRVTLDPQNVLPEANESNNVATAPVIITAATSNCPPTISASVPVAVGDNGATYSSLLVSDPGDITRISLSNLRLQHADVSELTIHLFSPAGIDLLIFDGAGCRSADIDLSFDNASKVPLPCPTTGATVVHPSGSLAPLAGQPAAGLWTLQIVDRASGNSGTLQSWQLDICTKPACVVAASLASTDLPKSIPDGSSTTSFLRVPVGTGAVGRVELIGVQGHHTYVHDLEFHLTSPSGHEVKVLGQSCGAEDAFDFSLSDFGSTQLPCPPTDGFPHLPSSGLTAFIGESADGPWRLTVFDRAPQDTGVLDAWGLRLCPLAAAPPCPPTPSPDCHGAAQSTLFLRSSPVVGRRRLEWTWSRGLATLGDFGNPMVDTSYSMCLYRDDALVSSYPVLAGGLCDGGTCWKKLGIVGYDYRQRGGNGIGVSRVRLRSGSEMAFIQVSGGGAYLQLPLPLTATTEVRAQLRRSASAECWESVFPSPAVNSTDQRFRDRTP